jgi:peptidoglycan/LPS O-acetylase OafA/YrhL
MAGSSPGGPGTVPPIQPLWRAGLYGVVLAGVWVLLAWLNDTTLHFAPLLVAAFVPLGAALAGEPPPFSRRLAATAVGAALALAATAVVALSGHLDGPSLLPAGGAVAEAVAFSLSGALIGLVLGTARRRGG